MSGHSSGRPTPGCYCEWCTDGRRIKQRRDKLRKMGRPATLDGEQVASALAKLQSFHAQGMSTTAMQRQTGIHHTLVGRYVKGHGTADRGYRPIESMLRTTFEKIQAMELEVPMARAEGWRIGALVPSLGARRRMQALVARGFGYKFCGEAINSSQKPFERFVNEKDGAERIYFSTRVEMAQAYEKYRFVDPADVGVSPIAIARSMRTAKVHGWAPPMCWDDDTIDDPEAFPEWTGRCGTADGYRDHWRFNIALRADPCPSLPGRKRVDCGPCRTAKLAERRATELAAGTLEQGRPGGQEGPRKRFDRVAAEKHFGEGRSLAWIAAELGANRRTVARYKKEWKESGGGTAQANGGQ